VVYVKFEFNVKVEGLTDIEFELKAKVQGKSSRWKSSSSRQSLRQKFKAKVQGKSSRLKIITLTFN
jgi:hypothetical protein